MGGFERANAVTDAAAPTFSEFLYYIFRNFAPKSAVRSLSDRRKGRLQQVVKMVMKSPGRELSPTSAGLETGTPQPSPNELETIRAELRELREARERDAETLQELLQCVQRLTRMQPGV
jgi:hypothetical protein